MGDAAKAWAASEFGDALLGDVRRTRRLVTMAAGCATRRSGRVSEVMTTPAERQAAYDFLEHDAVSASLVQQAAFDATARRCKHGETVYVAVDGSSLSLTERVPKGFGSVGSRTNGGRGLKVMSALAIDAGGVPLGLVGQRWWARENAVRRGKYRPAAARESAHWGAVVAEAKATLARFPQQEPRMHVLADQEADAALLLRDLLKSDLDFTIRSPGQRRLQLGSRTMTMREALAKQAPCAKIQLSLRKTHRRAARDTQLQVRVLRATFLLRDHLIKEVYKRELTVVAATELGGASEPLQWFLLTNLDVRTAAHAVEIVRGYTRRWRIEDFHRAWKTGGWCVEETQLRKPEAVIKWATILAAVATRAERLRLRARSQPELDAREEFSDLELEVIRLLKRTIATSRERVTEDPITLRQALDWLADIGGRVRTKANPLPGATTIARGLETISASIPILEALRKAGRLR